MAKKNISSPFAVADLAPGNRKRRGIKVDRVDDLRQLFDAVQELFKETGCLDLYDGEATAYVKVAVMCLRDANQRVRQLESAIRVGASLLERD